ncbi:hypothetical protein OH76DRAFT_1399415 [Lentinus brumalis]|uniref:HNH nuclease domain-containing protein n=1 Tax=Lentinus brumalis TaxID=2498619 RepID=A0A371DLT8_9APHY|nr:hypothetical protein OH76DRAFT_1399415 [Polyporus brumalis]
MPSLKLLRTWAEAASLGRLTTAVTISKLLQASHIIRIFRRSNGPTPSVSPADGFPDLFEEPSEVDQDAWETPHDLKEKVMLRDDRCCVFTGLLDVRFFRAVRAKRTSVTYNLNRVTRVAHTDVAHIVSQPLSEGTGGLTDTVQRKFSIASIFDRLMGIKIRELLSNLDLHNPINAVLAEMSAHIEFDLLGIWLTPAWDAHGQVIPDTYDVGATDPDARRLMHITIALRFVRTAAMASRYYLRAPFYWRCTQPVHGSPIDRVLGNCLRSWTRTQSR